MASIDRVMALAEELKKKKKDPNYQINQSMINVTDLATDIKSGNRESLQSFIESDRSMFDAPIGSLNNDKDERSWFKKGLLEDGYDFGDISKTLLGTIKDVKQDASKGILGIGEGLVDTVAYGVGGIAKAFGNDDFADKTKKFIARNWVEESKLGNIVANSDEIGPTAIRGTIDFFKTKDTDELKQVADKILGADFEDSSLLGDKSDSLVQSGGQLAGTIGLQAVGVPWFVTTGVTSFGKETESAFNQDATYGEAGFSGLVSAGAEILTEKLSGGISFGSKTVDDLWKKPLMDKISNKTVQTLTKFGIDVVGEGTEEVLTEIMSNLGKKLSYEDEKTWNEMFLSEEAMDNYLEAFIGGAVLGGGFNLGRVSSSIKTGRDYDTNLTENEQVVIDIETNNRIEEQEKDGNKLTNKEKAEIQEQVMNDLEKGYISTDTIESTLGGDTYNQLKSIRDNQTNIQNQIAELENKANAEITVKEMERLQALREELSQTDTKTLETQLQSEMGQKIQSDAYLQRSYQEKSNRSVKFEADLSKYDAKQQAVVQKAIDSGILNNTNRTHDFVDMVAKISADKGISFDFTNNENLKNSGFAVEGKTVNGYIQDGNIAVNIDSPKALNRVVGHEITHVLEGTEFYTELQNAVKQYATTKGEYDSRLADLTNLYKDVKGANVENELTADLVGDYLFTDPDFVNNLSTEKPSLFKKVYDEIKHLYKMATAGSKEARELLKVKKAFEKAYRENIKGKPINETSVSEVATETTTEAITETTSRVDSLGRELTAEQIAFFEDSKVRDAEGNLLVMYHGTRADFNIFDMNRAGQNYDGDWSAFGKGFYFTPNKEAANEFSSAAIEGDNKNVKEVYLNITKPFYTEDSYSDTLSNLKERYNLDDTTLDKGYKVIEALNKNGYDSTEVLKELGYDGVIDNYDGKIEEAVAFESNQIKDIDNKKPTLSEDTRYSLSEETDSTGYPLLRTQIERFKDTKVVDENGRLKVVYHGSNYAGFTEFGPKNGEGNYRYGDAVITFFTDSEHTAATYTKSNEKVDTYRLYSVENAKEWLETIGLDEAIEIQYENGLYTIEDIYEEETISSYNTEEELLRNFKRDIQKSYGDPNAGGIYEGYINITNPYVVEGNGANWNELTQEGFGDADRTTNDIVKEVMESGKYDGVIFKNIVDRGTYYHGGHTEPANVYVTFAANQFKAKDNYNPTDDNDMRYSMSNPNEQTAPSRNDVFGSDIKLDLAPIQEEIQALTETITELRNNMESAITKAIPDNVVDMGRANTIDDLPMIEKQNRDSFNTLEAPTVMEEEVIPEYEGNTNVESPFDNRDIDEVGKRSIKAYQYENPEVRPFFQQEARAMLEELNDSIKGERYIIGDTSQNAYGDYEYSGTKRMTSPDIEYLLDNFNYTYADIEKGLRAIIEDHGAENIAVAKRIEFILDERLRKGYDTFGTMSIYEPHVEPNQAYINLLQGMEQAEQYSNAPIGEAPVEDASITEEIAPVREQFEAPNRAAFNEAVRESARVVERDLGYVPQNPTQESTYDEIAEILTEEPTTANERNQRQLAIIAANVLDKGLVFENVALKNKNRELMAKWDYTLTSEARAQTAIGQGHYDNETGETISKSLNEIMEEVNNTGLTKQFYEYIYHKHNVDRMQLADKFEDMENKPVFGFDVTAEDSQEIVNQYEFSNPEFIDFAQDVYDYVNADRKLLVDNGVISQETADLWNKMYPHYVPIRREGHNGNAINVPLDTGRTGINAPIKKATGGSSNILPLFDTMAMRTLQTYRATAKNSFGVELMKTLGTKIESTTTNVDEVIDSVDAQESLLQENNGKPTFTVFENGEKITFSITKDMYDALKPLSDSSILSKTIKPLNVASSFHRGLLTQYNPVFALTNGIKDMQDILLNSQHAAKTYSKIPEAYAQVLKKGYWYQEYMANGGEHNSYFDSQDNTFQTENKGIKKLLDLPPLKQIAQVNDFIEIIPRLSEYIASREMGRSIEVSMLDAARVTTNFKAGGNLTKFLNRNGATFLNASVQGAMQQVRNVREAKANGIKGWANLATKFTIAGLPAILLNALLWEDDDEYEELSDYVKQNYYVVAKTDDGKFIRIPKGRTVAVIQDAVEQMKNFVTGDDEVDLASFIELMLTNLAPSNPIDNNVFAPIIQAVNNQTWYGEDLVPTRLQDLPKAEQYDESTDSFSKWLGGVLNISPVKINYLLDQYSGGVGDVVLPMLTPEAESGDDSFLGNMFAPLKSKFTTDAVMNNQNVSDFYSKSEELTTNAKKSNATDEDVLKNKYINSVKAEMNELYKEKREIQNSDLPSSEKYNQVREIQGQINELSKNALNSYEDINIQGNYSSVGDREYHKDTKNEWKAINSDEAAALNSMGMSSYDKDNYFSAKNQITNVVKNYKNEKENMDTEDEEYEGEVSTLSGEKKVSIINAIKNAGLNDEQMAYLYDKYYASTEKLNTVVKTGIGMYAYLDLESQNFTADVNAQGKTISGSKKTKIFDYINSMDIGFEQRVILAKMYYPSYDEYNYDIIDYLNNDDSISFSDMKEILETLDFKVYDDGTITWD